MSLPLIALIQTQINGHAHATRQNQSLMIRVPLSDALASFVMQDIKDTTALPVMPPGTWHGCADAASFIAEIG
ncbi:MAG: hypothetical protein GDA36_01255 [Rhodobacteraceae bacterium]|nr:hypothetical protein [Paracoccaceae bacterium]